MFKAKPSTIKMNNLTHPLQTQYAGDLVGLIAEGIRILLQNFRQESDLPLTVMLVRSLHYMSVKTRDFHLPNNCFHL